jgi:hypothetical protein
MSLELPPPFNALSKQTAWRWLVESVRGNPLIEWHWRKQLQFLRLHRSPAFWGLVLGAAHGWWLGTTWPVADLRVGFVQYLLTFGNSAWPSRVYCLTMVGLTLFAAVCAIFTMAHMRRTHWLDALRATPLATGQVVAGILFMSVLAPVAFVLSSAVVSALARSLLNGFPWSLADIILILCTGLITPTALSLTVASISLHLVATWRSDYAPIPGVKPDVGWFMLALFPGVVILSLVVPTLWILSTWMVGIMVTGSLVILQRLSLRMAGRGNLWDHQVQVARKRLIEDFQKDLPKVPPELRDEVIRDFCDQLGLSRADLLSLRGGQAPSSVTSPAGR